MKYSLNILKSIINIGLERPVKLLHITDSHLTCQDYGLTSSRVKNFSKEYENDHIDYFLQAIEYAKKNGLILLHTGDLMDFVSEANFALLSKCLSSLECIYAVGNHDFCRCDGESDESYNSKKQKSKTISPYRDTTCFFDSRIIRGVNFITVNNSNYQISEEQIELLKKEVLKSYPIILAMHIPFFTVRHADAVLATGLPCAYLSCAISEYLSKYPKVKQLEQMPNEVTLQALEYIRNEPLIKAVITGHTHINMEEDIGIGLFQYTTGAGYLGYAREITII